ncbi:MAG: hypothetical protein ACT4P4_00605 [Betaproteobacteria bacterium]
MKCFAPSIRRAPDDARRDLQVRQTVGDGEGVLDIERVQLADERSRAIVGLVVRPVRLHGLLGARAFIVPAMQKGSEHLLEGRVGENRPLDPQMIEPAHEVVRLAPYRDIAVAPFRNGCAIADHLPGKTARFRT